MNPIAFRPWIALAFTGLALAALWVPLADPDIWWHLEAGREMVARGGLIRTDPFCHSSLGREWIDLHWIFQLVVYGLWKLGGPWAITLAKTVSLAGALVVLVWKRKRSFEPFGWLAAALAVLLFRESVDARPLVATLFVLALQWRLLDAEPGKSLGPMAFLAVGLQVLMANLQGLSWLGPITALGVMLPDAWSKPPDLWRRGGILGGMCLACLVTPWPLAGARLPFELFARFLPGSNPFHLAVSENVPLFSMIHTRPGLVWGTLWMGLAALVAQEISGRWRPSNLALFGATGGLAMLAVRNVPIACLGCVFVIARESPRIWAILQRKGRVFRRHSLAVHLGLAAMIGLLAIPSL